ncbi:unnamed protein product [Toxocara canis]|uniref:C-type lectin domain-containing protein n=1 Tax=Toxocara canis TaxID=6265 RepID=A0A183TW20_TOXCA|nr:unnamed protein product [Toxocara canis]
MRHLWIHRVLQAVLLLAFFQQGDASSGAQCWCAGTEIDVSGVKHCFELGKPKQNSWTQANDDCVAKGGHLAHLSNPDTYDLLLPYLKQESFLIFQCASIHRKLEQPKYFAGNNIRGSCTCGATSSFNEYLAPIMLGYSVGNVEQNIVAVLCQGNTLKSLLADNFTQQLISGVSNKPSSDGRCVFTEEPDFMLHFRDCDTASQILCDRPYVKDYCEIEISCTQTTTTLRTTSKMYLVVRFDREDLLRYDRSGRGADPPRVTLKNEGETTARLSHPSDENDQTIPVMNSSTKSTLKTSTTRAVGFSVEEHDHNPTEAVAENNLKQVNIWLNVCCAFANPMMVLAVKTSQTTPYFYLSFPYRSSTILSNDPKFKQVGMALLQALGTSENPDFGCQMKAVDIRTDHKCNQTELEMLEVECDRRRDVKTEVELVPVDSDVVSLFGPEYENAHRDYIPPPVEVAPVPIIFTPPDEEDEIKQINPVRKATLRRLSGGRQSDDDITDCEEEIAAAKAASSFAILELTGEGEAQEEYEHKLELPLNLLQLEDEEQSATVKKEGKTNPSGMLEEKNTEEAVGKDEPNISP